MLCLRAHFIALAVKITKHSLIIDCVVWTLTKMLGKSMLTYQTRILVKLYPKQDPIRAYRYIKIS